MVDLYKFKVASEKAEVIMAILDELDYIYTTIKNFTQQSGGQTKFEALYQALEILVEIHTNLSNLLRTQDFRNEAETFASNAKASETNAKLSENASKLSENASKQSENHSANSETNALSAQQNVEAMKSVVETSKQNIADMQLNVTQMEHSVQTHKQEVQTLHTEILNNYANLVDNTIVSTLKTWSSNKIENEIVSKEASTKAYTDTKFAQIMGGVTPSQLDSINELATALTNNKDGITAINNTLATKLNKTETAADSEKLGGVLASNYMTDENIANTYTAKGTVYTKTQSDEKFLQLAGGWITGDLKVSGGLIFASVQGLSFSNGGRIYKPNASTFQIDSVNLNINQNASNAITTAGGIESIKRVKANEGFYWGEQSLDVRYVRTDTKKGWTNLALINAWESESTLVIPSVRRTSENIVYLRGSVKMGAKGTSIAQLPTDFRPNRDINFIVRLDNDYGRLLINTYGYITIQAIDGETTESTYVSLEVGYAL